MGKRKPPSWAPGQDTIAKECGITPVTYGKPIPELTWCHYCGYLANTRDHIVPDSAGGVSAWWNLVPSCRECNNSKADRQACSCMFCVRAIALWHLGFRRQGESYRDRRIRRKTKRRSAA